MIRKVVLFASLSILASCATPSSRPPAEVAQPRPIACDARLTAGLKAEPQPPAGASLVQPATAEERAATAAFLAWFAAVRDWGQGGWERAGLAKTECERR